MRGPDAAAGRRLAAGKATGRLRAALSEFAKNTIGVKSQRSARSMVIVVGSQSRSSGAAASSSRSKRVPASTGTSSTVVGSTPACATADRQRS